MLKHKYITKITYTVMRALTMIGLVLCYSGDTLAPTASTSAQIKADGGVSDVISEGLNIIKRTRALLNDKALSKNDAFLGKELSKSCDDQNSCLN